MKRNYKIYIHKNKINGKVYIGQTYTSLRTRFGKNGIKYKGCPIFYNAIQKYGWDNFEHEILEENIPNAEISNEREKYYFKGFGFRCSFCHDAYSLRKCTKEHCQQR